MYVLSSNLQFKYIKKGKTSMQHEPNLVYYKRQKIKINIQIRNARIKP